MVLALTDHGLAPPAATIHGCWTMKVRRPAPAMDTGRIRAPAARRNLKRSIPAATVIAMARGSSIPPASIGVPVLAETAARRTMTTLRTA